MKKCPICRGEITTEEAYTKRDWRTDRSLCFPHQDKVAKLIIKHRFTHQCKEGDFIYARTRTNPSKCVVLCKGCWNWSYTLHSNCEKVPDTEVGVPKEGKGPTTGG